MGRFAEKSVSERAAFRQGVAACTSESTQPIAIAYSRCDIVDDDFPEGDYYELEFDGKKILLTKKGGRYLVRE